MQHIFSFVQKYKYFLLFLLLEIVALALTFQSHSFHRSKLINSSNIITGVFLDAANSFFEYTALKIENKRLAEENTFLRNILYMKEKENIPFKIDTTFQKNVHIVAKVIKNSYTKRNNILTLNKGTKDGLTADMGVVNSQGVVGVVNNVSDHYATVISVLSKYLNINASLKNGNHFGTLAWDGNNYRIVQLHDLQRQAPIQLGDTIVSGGNSILFPEGILIGIIEKIYFNDKTYENIQIKLFNDMSNIGYVYVIKNKHKQEIEQLENQND